MAELTAGLSAVTSLTVTEETTAAVVGSGSLAVLATPVLVAEMEKAACAALKGRLDEGSTTVGSRVSVDHLAPTPVGAEVRVKATLTSVDERMLAFSLEAEDCGGVVARGSHTRVIVCAQRFLEKAGRRTTPCKHV